MHVLDAIRFMWLAYEKQDHKLVANCLLKAGILTSKYVENSCTLYKRDFPSQCSEASGGKPSKKESSMNTTDLCRPKENYEQQTKAENIKAFLGCFDELCSSNSGVEA